MANGVLLGLTAALCWGVADYCLRGATKSAGTFRALYFMQVIGLLALLLGVETWSPLGFAGATLDATLAAAGISLIILLGAALLYRSFAIGKLAVVSPIAASFGAVTAILALLSGDRPSAPQFVGIGLLLCGVVLSGIATGQPADQPNESGVEDAALASPQQRRLLGPGVAEALGATALFGVGYWLMRYVVDQIGSVQVAMIGKAADLVALTLIVLVGWASRRLIGAPSFAQGTAAPAARALAPRTGVFWGWLIPGAILDTAANVAYNVGVAGALTSVVATLSSLFTAVTVVLAWVFLRERLTRIQWVGVALILAGIALVNL